MHSRSTASKTKEPRRSPTLLIVLFLLAAVFIALLSLVFYLLFVTYPLQSAASFAPQPLSAAAVLHLGESSDLQRTLFPLLSILASDLQLSSDQAQASWKMFRLLLHPQLYFFLSEGDATPHFLVVVNFKRLGWLVNQWMRRQFQSSESDSLIWLPEPELYVQQDSSHLLVMDSPDMLPSPAAKRRPEETSLLTGLSDDGSHLQVLILAPSYCLELIDDLWEELALREELERWQLDPEQITQATLTAKLLSERNVQVSLSLTLREPESPERWSQFFEERLNQLREVAELAVTYQTSTSPGGVEVEVNFQLPVSIAELPRFLRGI